MALGDPKTARGFFSQALTIGRRLEAPPLVLEVLTGVAEYLAATNKGALAAQLLVRVLDHPASRQTTKERARHLLGEEAAKRSDRLGGI